MILNTKLIDEMNKQARIERISKMEDRLDEATRLLGKLNEVVGEFEDFKGELEALKVYMSSGEWKMDYEADESGLIPADVKRGVLSEDALYNLLQDADQIIAHARKVFAE